MYDVIVADFNSGRQYIVENKLDPQKTIIVSGMHNVQQMLKIKRGDAVVHKVTTRHLENDVIRALNEVARNKGFEIK